MSMETKKIMLFGSEYEYVEHKGIIRFPTVIYIKMFDKEQQGDPTLEAIYQFEKRGYEFISESFTNLYFRKKL